MAALTLASHPSFAGVDCPALDKSGEQAKAIVPDFGSGRDITGLGRVQFYSAPDGRCKMSGLFVVPGDTLFAKFEHGGYTKVAFIARKKSDVEVTAWVLSSRLKENGKGVVPGHAVDGAEIARFLKEGKAAIARRQFELAVLKCHDGLDQLGDAYWSMGIVDDTEQKLVSADAQQRDGKLDVAATAYCRTLEVRLGLFNRK